jgi:hypothetical protein
MDEQKRVNVPSKLATPNTLSIADMLEATHERVYEISREFTQGFKFLAGFPRSVTFFGSTRFKEDHPYYIKARNLAGRIVKELDYSVISGGGPGIMEAASRGAKDAGGNSIGLTIRLPKEQVMNDYLTNHIDFYYFFSRKVCLAYSAEAFIFFPGGFGTLDEFSEIVTLLQTRKVPRVPVILVGSDYWKKVSSFLKDTLLAVGTIEEDDFELFQILDDEDEILSIIKNAPIREMVPYDGLKVNPIDE